MPYLSGKKPDWVEAAFGDVAARAKSEGADDWTRLQVVLHDESTPMVLDVVADRRTRPEWIVYLLPGAGLNVESNFLNPREHNLALYLARQGALVVGITPREDQVDPATNPPELADWGLAKHRADVRTVVAAIDDVLRLPYDMLGHSAGAAVALDYAAHHSGGSDRLRRTMVMDTTGPYDPSTEPELHRRAVESLDVLGGMLEHPDPAQRRYLIDPGLKAIMAAAVDRPDEPSGVPWPPDPENRRFTNLGFAHFVLIETAALPGATNWVYHRGFAAGQYSLAVGSGPTEDDFDLTHSPFGTVTAASAALGGGAYPTALIRDLMAIWADDRETYPIDWGAISVDVIWVNAELGRGDHPRGAELIRAGGNTSVAFDVVGGYGHADPVWSASADSDYWTRLAPPPGC